MLGAQIPGPHPLESDSVGWGGAQEPVSDQVAGELGVWPGQRTTDLAYPPPLRDEWTGTEESPWPVATLTKLFSLELLPGLTLITQSDSVVHGRRAGHTGMGSNPSFDLPLRWGRRQIPHVLCFPFPSAQSGDATWGPGECDKTPPCKSLLQRNEGLRKTAILRIIEQLLRCKDGFTCFT